MQSLPVSIPFLAYDSKCLESALTEEVTSLLLYAHHSTCEQRGITMSKFREVQSFPVNFAGRVMITAAETCSE